MSSPFNRAEAIAQRILEIMRQRNVIEADAQLNQALYNKAIQDYANLNLTPGTSNTELEAARMEIHVALDRVLDTAGILPKLIADLAKLAAEAQQLRDAEE